MANIDTSEEKRNVVFRNGRTIYFFDEVNNASVCEVIRLIQDLTKENPKKPIELVINSIGGDIYDGLALYDNLRHSNCKIITIGQGIIASMAVIVFLAGDIRLMTKNARLMYHQASLDFTGKLSDAEVDIRETRALEEITLKIVAERTGQSIKKLTKDFKSVDKYISAEKCIQEGYAHKIIQNKKGDKQYE
jgi:ATP-dependent Clp protease protease subunit